jgi:hypothetical protein
MALAGNIANVESDPKHRHQPWQLIGRSEAQEERRAVDGKMQLIAERQNDHRSDEEHRYSAKRFCRFGRFCRRRLLHQPALDPR